MLCLCTNADNANNKENVPCGSNETDIGADIESGRQKEEREMVQSFMMDRHMEVIAVVEGVDSATGGNVQSRHSYVFDEIQWNRTFVPCVYEDVEQGIPVIDFSVFHKLQPVYNDSAFPGVVASMI